MGEPQLEAKERFQGIEMFQEARPLGHCQEHLRIVKGSNCGTHAGEDYILAPGGYPPFSYTLRKARPLGRKERRHFCSTVNEPAGVPNDNKNSLGWPLEFFGVP